MERSAARSWVSTPPPCWHHWRHGKAEALLERKWPSKCNGAGYGHFGWPRLRRRCGPGGGTMAHLPGQVEQRGVSADARAGGWNGGLPTDDAQVVPGGAGALRVVRVEDVLATVVLCGAAAGD